MRLGFWDSGVYNVGVDRAQGCMGAFEGLGV